MSFTENMYTHRLFVPPLKPCTTSWLVLLVLTTLSFVLGSYALDQGFIVVVLTLALIKGQLVARHFMGLNRVHALWRHIMTAYLLMVGGVIAFAYLIA